MTSLMALALLLLGVVTSSLGMSRTASQSNYGPVLGAPGLVNWAVVGDVTNESKPAYRVAQRLEDAGRTVHRVSPYDSSLPSSLLDIATTTNIDAVNLIISPRIGIQTLEDMAQLGIQYCFMQPGADAPNVVEKAQELGITVQRGCVLVQSIPDLES